MKAKGKIFQIIKWEEKERYFHNCVYGGTAVDLLNVGGFEEARWHDQHIFGLFKSLLKISKKFFNYENMALDACRGLPVLVGRPHNFTVGESVVVEITLKHADVKK